MWLNTPLLAYTFNFQIWFPHCHKQWPCLFFFFFFFKKNLRLQEIVFLKSWNCKSREEFQKAQNSKSYHTLMNDVWRLSKQNHWMLWRGRLSDGLVSSPVFVIQQTEWGVGCYWKSRGLLSDVHIFAYNDWRPAAENKQERMEVGLTTSLFTVKTLSARLSTAIHLTGILAIRPCL